MTTRKERINLHLDLFLKSRKTEKTKEYSKVIIDFLESMVDPKTQGWVRSKDLKDALVPNVIPSGSTFFNLLADMESFRLIEKEERVPTQKRSGKPPVYYRTRYDEWEFMPHTEAIRNARIYYYINRDCKRKLGCRCQVVPYFPEQGGAISSQIDMKFCVACGKQIGRDAKFCKFCGAKFNL